VEQQQRHDGGGGAEIEARPVRKDPDRIAGWRVDPSGRYPFRFHNGRRWTGRPHMGRPDPSARRS